MLEFVKGDFFDFDADIRVNTVNCVGVMGAGVALAFKNKYPNMFKEYVRKCKAKEILPGRPSVWREGDMFSKGIEIINFPTKNHWRNPSEYEYVEDGLAWLSGYLKDKKDVTLTLPALGCGHGGLDWARVKKLVKKYLEDTQAHILVFEPESSKRAGKIKSNTPESSAELEALDIHVITKNESAYPVTLMRYTEKNLYLLGNMNTEFDIAVVSSTKPSDKEILVIEKLIDYCEFNDRSVLFGGSAFDKRMASLAMERGIKTGVFLPSGMSKSAEKMRSKRVEAAISILSIGNPFVSFDRKEYMPSVLSRMFIAKSVVFTTNKLKWLEKQNKIITKNGIISYFVNYDELPSDDYIAAKGVNSNPVAVFDGDRISFDKIRP